METDEYAIWRTAPDASRLCYQHFLWRELFNGNIHPSIKLEDRQGLRIAEFAAGHCLWAMQVAQEFPLAAVEASDIDLNLVPPSSERPSNLSIAKWSFFDRVPEKWLGAFDLIHIRLLIQPFAGFQDPRPVLEKFVSMLKPGGYLQWDEYDYADADKGHVYSVDNPEHVPNPHETHNSSTRIWQLIMDTFGWPQEHFAKLSTYFTEAGLEEVQDHKIRPPPSVFRAFHEHWYALIAQLLPVLEAKDVTAGIEARKLVTQIREDSQRHGVFSAHITKFVVGRKRDDKSDARLLRSKL
ncbi:hypothetical protein LTR84_008259 [Exophiala bonariae]|uniref:Methyltransferase domain-containing protein n=1 Tax=Exophiala bonariae TaxID=1690606 RepID=A0AAV9N0P1_9EURO|nr:hypothetical protein LTR84_008259 [Exophiala bonariae]